ncbi:MarR family transcriptional regulator [Kaistia dalseonensis]|uniref:DNA-binding MarR family transcriptional regulator n=1 Tax=Kaistia dalseonensis TaxID=410840 RepID=A0ABU0H2P7_9HYPH|nr:MarR family transcriptional regulator [Kaistia dalseonensis]MCX5494002.1 MarR family transcriptional regulator [Kaistia dalseonensis]MDQ0436579.1 DNA-binding MarR family transcriptional regulator [Kaistia dalseonensis]
MTDPATIGHEANAADYVLDDQVGFILRQVSQRHSVLFLDRFGDVLTPTQWASMIKLHERGPLSQNLLGRMTAMDVATIKGVIDRLTARGLTEVRPDETDGRRRLVALTAEGHDLVSACLPLASAVTEDTLAPLSKGERASLLALLKKLR